MVLILSVFINRSNTLFNRDSNRGCLAYMFSLRFSGSNFLINLRRQFRVRKIYHIYVFAGFSAFAFCVYNYCSEST